MFVGMCPWCVPRSHVTFVSRVGGGADSVLPSRVAERVWGGAWAFPAFGLSSIVSQEMARSSYSRLPHMSQIQAGKLGTMISSSPSQVKYVICRKCITPAEHSRQGNEFEDGAGMCMKIIHFVLNDFCPATLWASGLITCHSSGGQ